MEEDEAETDNADVRRRRATTQRVGTVASRKNLALLMRVLLQYLAKVDAAAMKAAQEVRATTLQLLLYGSIAESQACTQGNFCSYHIRHACFVNENDVYKVLRDCLRKHKSKDSQFVFLSDAIYDRVRDSVGEEHWKKALQIHRQLLVNLQKKKRSSANVSQQTGHEKEMKEEAEKQQPATSVSAPAGRGGAAARTKASSSESDSYSSTSSLTMSKYSNSESEDAANIKYIEILASKPSAATSVSSKDQSASELGDGSSSCR